MVRSRFKCLFAIYFSIALLKITRSLPINAPSTVITTESAFVKVVDLPIDESIAVRNEEHTSETVPANDTITNTTHPITRQNVRPGQEVRQYAVEITRNGGNFNGRAVIDVQLTFATREDEIVFHLEDLDVQNVLVGVFTDANAVPTPFDVDDGQLLITPTQVASSYIVIIEYTGSLSNIGYGLYAGEYDDLDYVAMNLYPTNARRVFPCMDEPTEASTILFTFNNMEYSNMVSNSLFVDNSQTEFRPLQGPPHLWGMVAHNFQFLSMTSTNVQLYGRPQLLTSQESLALVALSNYFPAFNEWTNKPYSEIIVDQAESLSVIALPDVSRNWYALSTVCIWEPYVLMETSSSYKQRKKGFISIAEGLSRQWFGYVVHPENWRYQWVVEGLAKYAAYDIVKDFQTNAAGVDETLLDMNTIFVTDIIQESLYYDAYANVQVLEPQNDLFLEEDIRFHLMDIVNLKAPAILWTLRLMLGHTDEDFIKTGARALLNQRSLQTVNSFNFIDAINSAYTSNGLIKNIEEFLGPWLYATGYPMLRVNLARYGVTVHQERFGFSATTPSAAYPIPVSYTTSVNPNFDDIEPVSLVDGILPFYFTMEEEDWVIFNIQAQGYYRVNYDDDLWERIIWALEDPERREEIHPLNRASLVDDALNLARGNALSYEIAFQVVLTMEHETEYAVWKAFVRNMEFLKKNFDALIADDEDRDPDIYLRMVRRTIGMVESEIGFYPETNAIEPAMTSLTRGLVMEHACRANYQPCIAAAVDWFYDPNNNEVVNPNIPYEIRPAVYCTMVREGNDDVIDALYARLEIEPSAYERVVILESLACSQDSRFINELLDETIVINSPYNTEEKLKIFSAVARSSHNNANEALRFMINKDDSIRNAYGGPEKLEEALFALSENMIGPTLVDGFTTYVTSLLSNLDDSLIIAERMRDRVIEDLTWYDTNLEEAYEWIDENDAPTLYVSAILITLSFIVTLFNY